MIQLKNISVAHQGRPILKNVSAQFPKGTLTTIVGPNGSGKTTLVQVLLGQVSFRGERHLSEKIHFGYVPQKAQVNREMPLTVKGFLEAFGGKIVHNPLELLKIFGLEKLQHASFHDLSGGEVQRVLFIRALMGNPDVLVLDEVMAGLDLQGEEDLNQILQFWTKTLKRTGILVSHDLHTVLKTSDHVICLQEHICCEGTPETLQGNSFLAKAGGAAPYKHEHRHEHHPKVCFDRFENQFGDQKRKKAHV